MREYEFDVHRWSHVKDDEILHECVVTSRCVGWSHIGYEVRLYANRHLSYRSRVYLIRKLANDEAEALLRETLRVICQRTSGAHGRMKPSRTDIGGAVVLARDWPPSQ